MEEKMKSRRNILKGALMGAAAATVAVVATKTAQSREQNPANDAQSENLYRRTADVERYYKTLYDD